MPIFDQGYQHWTGDLSGHAWRWLTVTRHGVCAAMKNRWFRYIVIAAWLPALGLVVTLCLWGLIERQSSMVSAVIQFLHAAQPSLAADPRHYRVDIWRLSYWYFLRSELFFSMILVLIAGPSLISQDLRFNALPLYFSRPLRRIDYLLGKLGVIVTLLGMVMILPAVAAYILGLAFSLDVTIFHDTFSILLSSIMYGIIIAFSAGLLVLALSAMTRNSRYVALLWIGIWVVSKIMAGALQEIDTEQRNHVYYNRISDRPPQWDPNLAPDDRRKQMVAFRDRRQKAEADYRRGELEFSKADWRPLISYQDNLSRLSQELLKSNETWKMIVELQPDQRTRNRIMEYYMGPEYPWYWSASVLAGLFGLSACILHLSVKSLDRLK